MVKAGRSSGKSHYVLMCFVAAWFLCVPLRLGAQDTPYVYLDIVSSLGPSEKPDIVLEPIPYSSTVPWEDRWTVPWRGFEGSASFSVSCDSRIALYTHTMPTGLLPPCWWNTIITPAILEPPGSAVTLSARLDAKSGPQPPLPPGDYHAGTVTLDWYGPWVHPDGPATFGLFLGSNSQANGQTLRADKDATGMFTAFNKNLVDLPPHMMNDQAAYYTSLDFPNSPGMDLAQSIGRFRYRMRPGDTFVLYASAHGYQDMSGLETTATPGNEWLNMLHCLNSDLSDDALMTSLATLGDVQKWVFIDSCYSGGFWGNDNPADLGDLEKLSNIGFLAAAPEDGMAYFDSTTGLSYFGSALTQGLSRDLAGSYLNADLNHDNTLKFDELASWVRDYSGLPGMGETVAAEKAFGNLVSWSPGMWNPVSFGSPDFVGAIPVPQTIPAPGALLLGSIGLGLIAGWRRRRRTV